MTTRPTSSRPAPTRGFTLVELMVVIALMTVLLGILFPAIRMMVSSGKLDTGVNTITAATRVIRVYSTQSRSPVELTSGTSTITSFNQGTALVFTHAGEIRLTQTDFDGTVGTDYLAKWNLAAFEDIPNRDYIRLPSDIAVAGILRDTTGLVLIAAPFAVRFDPHGNLLAGYPGIDINLNAPQVIFNYQISHARFQVFYDGMRDSSPNQEKTNGLYDMREFRSSTYNPFVQSTVPMTDATANKIPLPFEQLESVVGVVVYNVNNFTNAGLTWGSSSSADINKWLLNPNNGRVIFFSRYTGSVVQDRK